MKCIEICIEIRMESIEIEKSLVMQCASQTGRSSRGCILHWNQHHAFGRADLCNLYCIVQSCSHIQRPKVCNTVKQSKKKTLSAFPQDHDATKDCSSGPLPLSKIPHKMYCTTNFTTEAYIGLRSHASKTP